MARVSKGAAGELLAGRHLREKGYDLLAVNYRTRLGEVDIIAADATYIVFVEVKTRAQNALYEPREAVTPAKQRRIVQAALQYLATHPDTRQPRFDVIEVVTKPGDTLRALELRHLENAFGV